MGQVTDVRMYLHNKRVLLSFLKSFVCSRVPSFVEIAFLLLLMSSKSHSAGRTAAQWVTWAQGEGYTDIVEHAPGSEPTPGLKCLLITCILLFTITGKVYCTLCAMPLTASASALKQHCAGYWYGTGESKKFYDTKHSQKVKKRKADAEAAPPPAPREPQAPIIIQVF